MCCNHHGLTLRNRLRDIEQTHRVKGNHRKADNIRQNNLGNQKWDRQRTRHRKQVRDHLCQAVHAVVDKAGTLTSISRRRGSVLALVNPAYTSQIDSRTGLLQGRRRRDRFCCLDGAVLDADVNAACNIPARLYDEETTLYMPYREVRALLAERTRTAVGTARPGLELQGLATPSPSTESEASEPVPGCTR